MSTSNTDLAEKLGEISGQLKELRNIVVGEDGSGGLRQEIKHLTSLRDKGLGVLLVMGLLLTVLGSTLREWVAHALAGSK